MCMRSNVLSVSSRVSVGLCLLTAPTALPLVGLLAPLLSVQTPQLALKLGPLTGSLPLPLSLLVSNLTLPPFKSHMCFCSPVGSSSPCFYSTLVQDTLASPQKTLLLFKISRKQVTPLNTLISFSTPCVCGVLCRLSFHSLSSSSSSLPTSCLF